MTTWEFPTSDPVDLQVRIPAGDVTVTAVPAQVATVRLEPSGRASKGERLLAAMRVEFDQGTLSVIAPERSGLLGSGSIDAVVELPEGSSCLVHTASADVSCTGDLSAVDLTTASGDVSVERVSGLARIVTASGDVNLGAAAEVEASTASGDLTIERADGDVSARTASGDVEIAAASGKRVDIKATSGDISVAVAPGIGVYLDLSTLSGTVSSELEPSGESGSADMTLQGRTISGDVQVRRAAR
jgi:Putative adhesin